MAQDPESVSLPKPPPPRPGRRDAAIDAALRRFDGLDEAPAARPAARGWSRNPQLGLALAASLVVVVGLPAAFIVLQDQDLAPTSVSAPPSVKPPAARSQVAPDRTAPPQAALEPTPQPVAAPPTAQPEPKVARNEVSAPAVAPAMPVVAAAPPLPPPPPAPPPAAPAPLAQKSAEAGTQDLVVTGSRIRQPTLTSPSPVTVLEGRSAERDALKEDRAYAAFLGRLQEAVRDDDRDAVVRLIHFPLRVNSGGHSRTYPDPKSVRRDFESIFTPRVRQSILEQRADRLFSRDLGVMIGNGEVWFDRVCLDASCSRLGPVRITAINR